MKDENVHLNTTRVEISGGETVTDFDPASPGIPAAEPHMNQLRSNFQSITQARAIYYPVAYRLIKELGRGRQGIVFLGMRQGARGCITRHAIKIFDPGIYPSVKKYWTDMGRLAVQTSRLQTVRSPNLVARDVYEETNGIGYMQMEAIDGIAVPALLDERNLNRVKDRCTAEEWAHFIDVIFRYQNGKLCLQPGIALYIMRQVLRGLETLHELEFVHSDIKPANIMIDRLGYAKLVDFGRAVRVREKMTFLFGTPLYMPPEVHRRQPNLVQSDLYSVGLVGLTMLRGEPIFDTTGMDESELLDRKLTLSGRLPELLPEHILMNEQLVQILRRFVHPDPMARFQSAGEAEAGRNGLLVVHQQLTHAGQDTEYGRELQYYVSKLLPSQHQRETDELTRDI